MSKHHPKYDPKDRRWRTRLVKAGVLPPDPEPEAPEIVEPNPKMQLISELFPKVVARPLTLVPISTVGELQRWSQAELRLIPGISTKRAQNIANTMAGLGLPLTDG